MAGLAGNLAYLSLEDGEEEATVSLEAPITLETKSLENCFVGSFLTSSVVSFPSMRATLANGWKPINGISITDLSEGRFLFCLFHRVDANRIEVGGSWNFNSYLLIMHRRLSRGRILELFHCFGSIFKF